MAPRGDEKKTNIKTEALHKELDSLDQVQEEDTDSGVKTLKNFLEDQEETSSSSPEEIEAPPVSGAGAGGPRPEFRPHEPPEAKAGGPRPEVAPCGPDEPSEPDEADGPTAQRIFQEPQET